MKELEKNLEATGGVPAEAELAAINRFAKSPLRAEEVYTFSLRLCDNEVDRDWERFDTAALNTLGDLFVGKSGIFDHQWTAEGQTARIYRTEMVREGAQVTAVGDGYCWLKAWAYLLRTEKNADLIAEIEGGIKREVSVGCSVARRVCSICGADRRNGDCGHKKGERYDGALCFTRLMGASDAMKVEGNSVLIGLTFERAAYETGPVKAAILRCTDAKGYLTLCYPFETRLFANNEFGGVVDHGCVTFKVKIR